MSNNKDQEKYRPLPGDTYMERREAERQDNFCRQAAAFAIQHGQTWDRFVGSFPQYAHYRNAAELERQYNTYLTAAERDRRAGKHEFTVEAALADARAKRAESYQQQLTERMYADHRDKLLAYAERRAPWDEVARKMELGPDCAGLYERARRELGTAGLPDAEDSMFAGFLDGFLD